MRRSLGLGLTFALLALPAVASAASISDVHVQGSFESGGVIVTLGGANGNESATLEVKGPGDADFHAAHPFVRYDNENLASSLFGLSAGTDYEVRVTLTDPDGVTGTNPATATVSTLAAPALPAPSARATWAPVGRTRRVRGTPSRIRGRLWTTRWDKLRPVTRSGCYLVATRRVV